MDTPDHLQHSGGRRWRRLPGRASSAVDENTRPTIDEGFRDRLQEDSSGPAGRLAFNRRCGRVQPQEGRSPADGAEPIPQTFSRMYRTTVRKCASSRFTSAFVRSVEDKAVQAQPEVLTSHPWRWKAPPRARTCAVTAHKEASPGPGSSGVAVNGVSACKSIRMGSSASYAAVATWSRG